MKAILKRADPAKEYVSKYYNIGGAHRLEANPKPHTERFFMEEEETESSCKSFTARFFFVKMRGEEL